MCKCVSGINSGGAHVSEPNPGLPSIKLGFLEQHQLNRGNISLYSEEPSSQLLNCIRCSTDHADWLNHHKTGLGTPCDFC